MNHKQFGQLSEQKAIQFLQNLNYIILDHNFYSKYGEIDIISQINNTIVFVEVKSTRYNIMYAAESINKTKQIKIRTTAQYYLELKELKYEDIRFDVILIQNNLIKYHLLNCF
ncbi:YraN family protein [Candidatus Marinamargulisbacteria bacterium SCGC AG-410-N11]|nr:YraN family protein [Candidatus Marinamargulisbacteria bacterium SCGC AG-410-N11]